MKNILTFCFYSLSILLIYGGVTYMYDSIINDFDMTGEGKYKEYLSVLYRFVFIMITSYIIIFYTTYRSFREKILFIDIISMMISLLFLYESIKLIYINYYKNYINIPEINSFVGLIEKYGSIVNMFYIFPLILAILYTVFVVWLYFKFKPNKE